jgi:putative colanic acid biosynthesis UDP-glucose lipid carrier transferase
MNSTLVNVSLPDKGGVLQRRSTAQDIRAFLDGLALVCIAYGLILVHVGAATSEYTIFVVLLLGALGLFYDAFGVYRKTASFTRKALDLLQAWTAGFALLVVLGYLTKQSDLYSRLFLAQFYVAGFAAQLTILGLISSYLRRLFDSEAVDHAIIVGTGQLARYINQRIASNPWLGQKVVGYVDIGQAKGEAKPDVFDDSVPVLGQLDQLLAHIDGHHVKTVYFAIPLNASELIESLYFKLLDRHVAVHWVPDIFSLRLVNHAVSLIAGVPVLTLSETPLIGSRKLLKSLEDVILSAGLLALFAPLMALIAIAIKLDSAGPVFFRQKRLGWGGRTFEIWKFRSMRIHQPHSDEVQQARRGDSRVTRVGAFLRRTSLDELPQFFNVLRGEMSLVGPRPHAIQHDHEYSKHIAHYFARHNIKPGITGLAQVRGLRGETREIQTMILRVESDIEYINNWSLWLDLTILARTLTAFTGRNAY